MIHPGLKKNYQKRVRVLKNNNNKFFIVLRMSLARTHG